MGTVERVEGAAAAAARPLPEGVDRPFVCPECPEIFATPEDLGSHLERHREVLPAEISPRGKSVTIPCPQGCGRHFKRGLKPDCTPNAEIKFHIETCDGSPPIAPGAAPAAGGEAKEDAVTETCERGCGKPNRHPGRCRGAGGKPAKKAPAGARPRPRAAAAAAPKGGGAVGSLRAAVEELRAKRDWHQSQAGEMERAIGELEAAAERLEAAWSAGGGRSVAA